MFLPFSWPRGHVLRGLQMELGEENGSDTWRVCYTQKQIQGVGVLGVHANTNGRQGSAGKEPLWHKQLQEQWSLY